MDIQKIKAELKSPKFSHSLHYLPEVDSTNLWAARTEALGPGEVFLTDFQTSGYGRLKRTWEAPRGKNILMTFTDTPPLDPAKVPQLTLVCGVAFARALRDLGVPVALKWPNDLLVQKRKLGGILCETDGSVVRIGVGLNVNSTPADYGVELKETVTSTLRELGRELPLESVIAACLNQYESARALYDSQGSQALIEEWNTLTFPEGTPVRISDDTRSIEAKYRGLTPDGFLLVQVGERIEKVLSGDLTLL